jgi:hypothetical protein
MTPIVQSLWIGPILTDLERLCIQSFIKTGHIFHLYTYGKVARLPKSAKLIIKDANEILPKSQIFKLKKEFLPFADIWRYKLLRDKGNYWVDMDMVALKKLDFKTPYVFSSEATMQSGAFKSVAKYNANIGVLKAPKGSPFYGELYEKCINYQRRGTNKNRLKYMEMMRPLLKKYELEKYVLKPPVFCPLHWWHTKEAFLPLPNKEHIFTKKWNVPGYTIKKLLDNNNTYTIHLWRSIATDRHNVDFNQHDNPKTLYETLIRNNI